MTDWFSDEKATFGDRLAHARLAAGLDQAAFAVRLGVGEDTVADWEADRAEPRSNRMQMIAGLLNVSLRWLLSGQGEGPSAPADDVPLEAAEVARLLADLRAVRAGMETMSTRMAQIEQRLSRLGQDAA